MKHFLSPCDKYDLCCMLVKEVKEVQESEWLMVSLFYYELQL